MKDCRNCEEKEDLVRMLIEKTNECTALGAKLNAAKDVITDAVCKNKYRDRAEKAEAMQNELCRLAADNAVMTGELNELRGVNSMLRKVLSEKDELIDTLRKENGKLQTRCAALENLNKGYEAFITEQDEKTERFRQECKDLQESGRRLAEEIREKDHEMARKDATIRELRGKLDYLLGNGRNGIEPKEEQPNDLYSASRRFFEALFSYADGNENGADA